MALAVLHNACSPRLAASAAHSRPQPQLLHAALALAGCADLLVAETAIQAISKVVGYAPARELAAQLGLPAFFARLLTSADSALLRPACQRLTRERAAHAIRQLPALLAPAGLEQASIQVLRPVLVAEPRGALSALDGLIARNREALAQAGGGGCGRGKKGSAASAGRAAPAGAARPAALAHNGGLHAACEAAGSHYRAEEEHGAGLGLEAELHPGNDALGARFDDADIDVPAHESFPDQWQACIQQDDALQEIGWSRPAPDVMQLAAGSADPLGLDLGGLADTF